MPIKNFGGMPVAPEA